MKQLNSMLSMVLGDDTVCLLRVSYAIYLQPSTEIIETTAKKRCCSGSHNQFKTLFKDYYMVRLKITSLYIYKDLGSYV